MRGKGPGFFGGFLLTGWLGLLGCSSSPSTPSPPISGPVHQVSSPLPLPSPFQKAHHWLRERNFARLLNEWKKLRGRASLLGKREYREISERAFALLLEKARGEKEGKAFLKALSLVHQAEEFRDPTPESKALQTTILEEYTEQMIRKALERANQGDFVQARLLIEKARKKNPHSPGVLTTQGRLSTLEGRSLYQRSQKILLESQRGPLSQQIQKLRWALDLQKEALGIDPGPLYTKALSQGRERLSALYFQQGRIHQGRGFYLLAGCDYLLAREMAPRPERIDPFLKEVRKKIDPYLTRCLIWDTRGDGPVVEALKKEVFTRTIGLPYLAHFSSLREWTSAKTLWKNQNTQVFRIEVVAEKIKLERQSRKEQISSRYLEREYQIPNPQYGLLREQTLSLKNSISQRALQISEFSKKAQELERALKKNFVYQTTYQGPGTPEYHDTVIIPRKLAPSQARKRREKFKELYGYQGELKKLKGLQEKEGGERKSLEWSLSRQAPLLFKRTYRKYRFSEETTYLFGSCQLKISLWSQEKVLFQKTFSKTERWRALRIGGVQKRDENNYENKDVPLPSSEVAREGLLRGLVREASDEIFQALGETVEGKLREARLFGQRGHPDRARETFLIYLLLSGKGKDLKDLTKFLISKRN